MKTRNLVNAIAFVSLIVLSSCTVRAPLAQPTSPTTSATIQPTESAVKSSSSPSAVESCGRTLVFAKAPERIVTTYPNAAELLIRLGLGNKIVGSMYHNDAPVSPDILAEYNKIPKQFAKYPSKEELISLKADLAVATYDTFDFSGQATMPSIDEAKAFGLQVYGLSPECGGGKKTAATLSMVYDDILALGKLFGVEAKAKEVVEAMQKRVAAVQQRFVEKKPIKAMIYYGGEGPLGVFTNGIYGDMLKLAGAESIFLDQPNTAGDVSIEEVANRNPEAIFVIEYGTPFDKMKDFLAKTFPNALAVKQDRIYLIDGGVFPPGYRNIEAVEAFANALYPNATSSFPLTLENCGKTLTFSKAPERVLVTYQNVAEILVKLGLKDKIVGVTYGQAYDPPQDMVAEVNGLNYLSPRGKGSAAKEIELSTRPDFVISAYPTYDFDPANGMATQEEFAAAGAPVYGISAECQTSVPNGTLESVYSDILNLGRIFGIEPRAQQVVQEMRDRIAKVQERVAKRTPVKIVFYDTGEDQIGVYGSGLNSDMIRLAGGENLFADQKEVYLQVSKEVFATKPAETFAILDYQGASGVPDESARAEFLFKTFPDIPASKAKNWVAVSGAAYAAGIRIPEAIETLAKALHPEAFK